MSTQKIAEKAGLKGPYTYRGRKDWNKLVRDFVPEQILRKPGASLSFNRLRGAKLKAVLAKKLVEEAAEIGAALDEKSARKRRGQIAEELADLLEVAHALASHVGVPWNDVRAARARKLEAKGGFKKGLFLEWTLEPDP